MDPLASVTWALLMDVSVHVRGKGSSVLLTQSLGPLGLGVSKETVRFGLGPSVTISPEVVDVPRRK